MIDPIQYGIGFLVYYFFSLITFITYSKKKEMTKGFVLLMIYIYYSMLAAYVINLVLGDVSIFEKIVQISIYWIVCGALLYNYYNMNIKNKDAEMFGDNSL